MQKILLWMSSLKIAIFLLITIAISSGIGTAIPQGENRDFYINRYQESSWLGFINGESIINLQLNHIYTSFWFLLLLIWLGLSLLICSFRRQIPSLKAALIWVDYKEPKQIEKLAIAENIIVQDESFNIGAISEYLRSNGWNVKEEKGRISARKGILGKFGPPLVHIGLVLLMIGSIWGSLLGEKIEKFLIAGNAMEFFNKGGQSELEMVLKEFKIDRDPLGRPEQFRSTINIKQNNKEDILKKEISVNHPLRYKGLTIYQADWSLAQIILQVDNSNPIKLPLTSFPELGEEIWGLVLPTKTDGSEPILLTAAKEEGPIKIFNEDGSPLSTLRPGDSFSLVKGIPLKVIKIIPASGLILKKDPGVPIVYTSFAITLIGSFFSILATRKFWAIYEPTKKLIHLGGLCNRNPSNLAKEISLIASIFSKH